MDSSKENVFSAVRESLEGEAMVEMWHKAKELQEMQRQDKEKQAPGFGDLELCSFGRQHSFLDHRHCH